MNDSARSPASARDDVARTVASLVRDEIRALTAYEVEPAAGLIKLDANENPFPLPAEVQARIAEAAAAVPLHRYPDGGAHALVASLRRAHRIPDSCGVLLGNGSDELIAIVTTALARPGAAMLVPEPTFVMYRMNALYAGMRFVGVPLTADLALDADAMLDAIARERPALVFLASPNNPTGNLFDPVAVERIVRASPGLVVVDEAYCAFSGTSALPRLDEFPNLLVLRTLSKIGMAALRLGYAVASPEWIRELNKVRQPYNVNALTQAVAQVVLSEERVIAAQVAAIVAERTRLAARLAALPGVRVFPADANFVLARVPDAARWFAALRAAGILVKNLSGAHPLLGQCLRITVGKPVENDALLSALNTIGKEA